MLRLVPLQTREEPRLSTCGAWCRRGSGPLSESRRPCLAPLELLPAAWSLLGRALPQVTAALGASLLSAHLRPCLPVSRPLKSARQFYSPHVQGPSEGSRRCAATARRIAASTRRPRSPAGSTRMQPPRPPWSLAGSARPRLVALVSGWSEQPWSGALCARVGVLGAAGVCLAVGAVPVACGQASPHSQCLLPRRAACTAPSWRLWATRLLWLRVGRGHLTSVT